ncbi:MAG: MFS transporter [Hyphomicrobiales bacterium]|nr:MFS transporter [Hyphomicrobiales bacterium]MCP4998409.1 MFS transporter [Hyphomicrobiales bacterium]
MTSSIVPIISLLMSAFFMLAAGGLAGYLLPLRAVQEGWSTFQISMIATGYAIGFTAGCLVVPRLVLRVGHVRVFAVLASAMAISMLMHALVVDPAAWILFRGITGFSIAGGYMVFESWLNERVTNETRGTVFSIYMVVSMIAVMAGQFLVPLGDPMTASLFMVAAIIYALALMPTGLSSAQSPQPLTQVSVNLKSLFLKSPAALVGAALSGVISGSWTNLAPVFAQVNGLSTATGATMLAVAMIGGAVFQIPLGRLSDRIDRRYMMAVVGVIGVTMCAVNLVVGAANIYLFLFTVFLLGSVLFAIYSIVVAHANDYAQPDEFVSTSSGLLIVYGGGTMLGPLISGALMDRVGSYALFIVIGVAFGLYGSYAYFRTFRRAQAMEEDRVDFQAIPITRALTPQTYELDPRVEMTSEDETVGDPA